MLIDIVVTILNLIHNRSLRSKEDLGNKESSLLIFCLDVHQNNLDKCNGYVDKMDDLVLHFDATDFITTV